MKPEEVAAYLKEHPEFFEDYAERLAEIYIPHPHGGRAIPISERQIVTLREKNRQLEGKLREVIHFGEENDAISEKVHRISLALLAASDIRGVLNAAYLNLREDFAVPHVTLRIWRPGNQAELADFRPVSDATREFAASLTHPCCIGHAMVDTAALFGEAGPHLRSFSYLPLRDSETFGLLALASEDPQRFYPEMGTLYLKRLGELVGAAVARHLT
ncbi:MAG: hypothetical protein A3I02_08105 [Betaproteobacteria bacterium RIFCSPLOWO2_02_FULL_67_26]|nr:MAG: hypothetical protein A3I02_08105 [Betaproteobacteria bacterium RIFCSPLOWO2_02_FULL_67_26]